MTVAPTAAGPPPWLLLAFSLPRKGASLRVAVWRKLQRYGAVPLGNSGYVLPNDAGNREKFEWLATTLRGSQGEASVLEVQSIDHLSGARIEKRFSEARKQDYLALLKLLSNAALKRPETARLRERFQEVVSIDFFGNPLRERVEKALEALEKPQAEAVAPDHGKVSRSAYLNRSWVTRPRPGIDRVTSAWLIRRFIDPKARFVFANEGQAP